MGELRFMRLGNLLNVTQILSGRADCREIRKQQLRPRFGSSLSSLLVGEEKKSSCQKEQERQISATSGNQDGSALR